MDEKLDDMSEMIWCSNAWCFNGENQTKKRGFGWNLQLFSL